jgi:hypothetical protein
MERSTSASVADPDSLSGGVQNSSLAKKGTVAHWNRPVRPVAAEPSVAPSRRVKGNHERNELSIRLWTCSITTIGPIFGN